MATEVYIDPKKTKLGEALGPNWVRIKGMGGLSAAASETVVNYIVNPFNEDVYILRGLAHIRTEDAQDADIDLGIADDAAGTSNDDSLSTSLVNSAKGLQRLMAALDGVGVAAVKWAKSGTATDSYIVAQQNGNADASSLVYDLYLEIIFAKDLNS